ncbi:hypothetical protein WN67_03940 [Mycolicibacterium obuense]|uniref:Uncharacterized protein n=1 Tax=Mycolicibacterium obuense TaxID=1807 RepID=A0A0M2K7S3_9MYCO|nr:hypothetical protein WN67_03940 [Mycolicibacterium obuense]
MNVQAAALPQHAIERGERLLGSRPRRIAFLRFNWRKTVDHVITVDNHDYRTAVVSEVPAFTSAVPAV